MIIRTNVNDMDIVLILYNLGLLKA